MRGGDRRRARLSTAVDIASNCRGCERAAMASVATSTIVDFVRPSRRHSRPSAIVASALFEFGQSMPRRSAAARAPRRQFGRGFFSLSLTRLRSKRRWRLAVRRAAPGGPSCAFFGVGRLRPCRGVPVRGFLPRRDIRRRQCPAGGVAAASTPAQLLSTCPPRALPACARRPSSARTFGSRRSVVSLLVSWRRTRALFLSRRGACARRSVSARRFAAVALRAAWFRQQAPQFLRFSPGRSASARRFLRGALPEAPAPSSPTPAQACRPGSHIKIQIGCFRTYCSRQGRRLTVRTGYASQHGCEFSAGLRSVPAGKVVPHYAGT